MFVHLADEPRKFIYGKRGQTLRWFYISFRYIGIAWAVAFFFLPQVFLGPISGDKVVSLRFFFYTPKRSNMLKRLIV